MFRARFYISIAISLATTVFSVSLWAEDQSQEARGLSREQILVSVTSFVGGTLSGAYARHEFATAAGRQTIQITPVLNGLGAPESATFIESALSGTAPGDVVRLQYTVGTRKALRQVITKLEQSVQTWEERVANLTAAHEALASRLGSSGAQLTSRQFVALKTEAENLNIILTDASARLQVARAGLRNALRKEQNVSTVGAFRNGLQITHDVLVTPATAEDMRAFYESEVVKPVRTRGRIAFTNVTISKIQIRNGSLVARHMMRAKAGLLGVAVAVGVIAEELTVGYIGRVIERDLDGHYAPEVRIEPKTP